MEKYYGGYQFDQQGEDTVVVKGNDTERTMTVKQAEDFLKMLMQDKQLNFNANEVRTNVGRALNGYVNGVYVQTFEDNKGGFICEVYAKEGFIDKIETFLVTLAERRINTNLDDWIYKKTLKYSA